MEKQTDLPKPQTDLPLPEKEIPAHVSTPIWKNKFFLGFVAISFLVAFLIGGLAIGRKTQIKPASSVSKATPTADSTANWKTYDAPSFQIKYPTILAVDKKFINNPTYSFYASASGKNQYIEIDEEFTGTTKGIDQSLSETIAFGVEKERFYNSRYIGKVKIDGQEALSYATDKPWAGGNLVGGVPGQLPPYKSYVIYSKGELNGEPAVKTIRIYYFAAGKNITTFEQMVSTFKFTK